MPITSSKPASTVSEAGLPPGLPVRTLAISIDETYARSELSKRGRLAWLWPTPRPALSHLPRIKQVYLPHWLFELSVESRRGPGTLTAAVDAHAGAYTLCEFASPPLEGPPEGECHPPMLSVDEAMRLAERDTTVRVLAQRGQRHRPYVARTDVIALLYWPYWLYYYERTKGRVDFRMMDASTGEKPGHKLKTAAIQAFLAAEKEYRPAQ